MIKFLSKYNLNCTGCGACNNICPVNAIKMVENKQGFLQASISNEQCIDCNRCKEVCPVLKPNTTKNRLEPVCYAIKAEETIRLCSSSGGAFSIFAKAILIKGGSVSGASLETGITVRHIIIDNINDLVKLQKSKYTQSHIGLIYSQIKTLLENKKNVLFCGCPCQVAGLKAYLGLEYKNLFLIDIFCHGVPSQKMLKESLEESLGIDKVKCIDFRDKNYGWECMGMTLTLDDGSIQRLTYDESRYEQGFHSNMTLMESCYNCKFCEFPRVGDISIGDFWNIGEFNSKLDDQRGTSLVLINSLKGENLFNLVKNDFEVCEKVPLEYVKQNRINAKIEISPMRDYFLKLYPGHNFNTSVWYAQQNKYDIGLVGNWSYPNYGSELTYYALYSALKMMGVSVLMISWPKDSLWEPYEKPQLFKINPYDSHDVAVLVNSRQELRQFNDRCQTFILGSDQLLNNNLYNWFNKFMQLDWVQDNKRKIAYASSFGCDYIWGSDEDRAELSYFLQKFDFFSVREESAVDLAFNNYGIKPTCVLDPIFLVPTKLYNDLIQCGNASIPKTNYLFTYILDLTKEKEDTLLEYAKIKNLEIYAALDGALKQEITANKQSLNTIYNLSIEEWLAYINGCKFMITDSFHGMCFAIIFEKQFIAVANNSRGKTRFVSMLNILGLEDRLVNSVSELLKSTYVYPQEIDYKAVKSRLLSLSRKSLQWLENSIRGELPAKSFSTYDLLTDRLNDIQETQVKIYNNYNQLTNIKKNQNELQNQLEFFKQEEKIITEKFIKQINLIMQSIDKEKQNSQNYSDAVKKQIEILKSSEQEITRQIYDLNLEIKSIRTSASYNIGRIITFIPRKIIFIIKKLRNASKW